MKSKGQSKGITRNYYGWKEGGVGVCEDGKEIIREKIEEEKKKSLFCWRQL